MTRAYHKVRRRVADINANLQESISGMRIVQAFFREDVNAEKFSDTNYQKFSGSSRGQDYMPCSITLVDVIALWALP